MAIRKILAGLTRIKENSQAIHVQHVMRHKLQQGIEKERQKQMQKVNPVEKEIIALIDNGDVKAKELYLRFINAKEYGDEEMAFCKMLSYLEERDEDDSHSKRGMLQEGLQDNKEGLHHL